MLALPLRVGVEFGVSLWGQETLQPYRSLFLHAFLQPSARLPHHFLQIYLHLAHKECPWTEFSGFFQVFVVLIHHNLFLMCFPLTLVWEQSFTMILPQPIPHKRPYIFERSTTEPFPKHMQNILKVKVKSFSLVQFFATPWTVAYHAPPSMGFSRQEYWSGLPFPSPEDLPEPGIEPRSPAL